MHWFISAVITGAIAFSVTNLDDILFLAVFFSQTGQKWQLIIGQYLGFTALVLISLIGFFGGLLLPHEWIRWLGIAPIFLGLKKLFERRANVQRRRSNTLSVAAVTFTNRADNIGIYGALFAVSDAPRVIVLIGVLYSLLAVWCFIAYRIHKRQILANTLRKYGYWLVPLVLIALGFYILLT